MTNSNKTEPHFIVVARPREGVAMAIFARPWPGIDAPQKEISEKRMGELMDDGMLFFTAVPDGSRWVKGAKLGRPITTVGDATEKNNWNALPRSAGKPPSGAALALEALMGTSPHKG